jgi:hypothetical protein
LEHRLSRKRRQRSTTIRKRIEKKQREVEKARRKEMKAAGGRLADVEVRIIVDRGSAEACAAALEDLGQRLAAEPIRGWTPADLGGDFGLAWLAERIREAMAEHEEGPLHVDILEGAKSPVLDKLSGLEIAAPGLKIDWESGFVELFQAVGRAEEIPPPEPEPEEGEEGDESDEGASGEGEPLA